MVAISNFAGAKTSHLKTRKNTHATALYRNEKNLSVMDISKTKCCHDEEKKTQTQKTRTRLSKMKLLEKNRSITTLPFVLTFTHTKTNRMHNRDP